MTQLKFHPATFREALDPIPFPRQSWMPGRVEVGLPEPRWNQGPSVLPFGRSPNAASMAETALDRAQRQMDRLKALLGSDSGDDRPSAA